MDDNDSHVCADDFHTLRDAFKGLVAEGLLPEAMWVSHVEDTIRYLTGPSVVDAEMILWIIRS